MTKIQREPCRLHACMYMPPTSMIANIRTQCSPDFLQTKTKTVDGDRIDGAEPSLSVTRVGFPRGNPMHPCTPQSPHSLGPQRLIHTRGREAWEPGSGSPGGPGPRGLHGRALK
jgi:hypothetical protein